MKEAVKELIRQVAGKRPLVVLAPHPDDEVIGCHMLMKYWQSEKMIWWFSARRNMGELHHHYEAPMNGFQLDINDMSPAINEALSERPVFAVPNSYDLHPLHREVTRRFHVAAEAIGEVSFEDVIYYSTSKNVPTLQALSPGEVEQKKIILADVYPDEKLWEKDESFVLFESYQMHSGESFVWVTSEFIGFHYWPDAPDETSFLRTAHRHLFKVTLKVSVGHHDREVEFFHLQKNLNSLLAIEFNARNLGAMSCEMMARKIAASMLGHFTGPRSIEVTVSEDGENGATICW